MLIVYRTNSPFSGQIVRAHRSVSAREMDVFLATKEGEDLAYIDISEKLADPAIVAALMLRDARYTVNTATKSIMCDGVPVSLGYDPADAVAKVAELDGDPLIAQLFSATDAQLSTFASTKTKEQLFVLTARALRRIAVAAGVHK